MAPSPADPSRSRTAISRRALLGGGLAGAAAFATPRLFQAVAAPSGVDMTLIAEAVTKTLIDGVEVDVWQLRDAAGSALGAVPSILVLEEGQSFTVEVSNQLPEPIDLLIPGVDIGPAAWIPAASSRQISFTAPTAGSYFAHGITQPDPDGEVARAMGLATPIVVHPAGGGATFSTGGPSYDRDYTLFLQELDDRLNAAVTLSGSSAYAMANYEPNYFFVNGLSVPATRSDRDTRLSNRLGDDVAVRLINGGQITYPMHFHGYHVDVIQRRAAGGTMQPETTVVEKDTVALGLGASADVRLPISQAGMFPMHTHYVPGVTANGTYVNPYGGGIVMMVTDIVFDDGFESGDTTEWSSS
ncbi:MAG: multicopper oxidase domain-containing protein [Acidobacteriota bacterium]